jgi:hypothetical protein
MKRKVSFYFLIDALGWTYLKEHRFLNDIAQVRLPLRTVLGYSSGAIPSILTGKQPREHGQWNLLFLSPSSSPFRWIKSLTLLPDICLENKWTRRLINILTRRFAKHEGYFSSYGLPTRFLPMFDLVEKKNIYRADGISGNVTIFDFWENENIPYESYSYHTATDKKIIQELKANIQKEKNSVYFAYLAEIDAVLHEHCKEEVYISNVFRRYEKWIREVIETAKHHYDEVSFFVFSDHGMTPVTRSVNLRALAESSGLSLGKDYLAVYDSTMGRFWSLSENASGILSKALRTCLDGHLIEPHEKSELGIDFDNNKYGDLIFLLDPGLVISPNFISSYMPQGMHGFHPDDPFSDGCYMSNVNGYSPRAITDLWSIFTSESLKY